jgi:hypothetical protein
MALVFLFFFEKYFVFTTLPKPFGDFDETWYKEMRFSFEHIVLDIYIYIVGI